MMNIKNILSIFVALVFWAGCQGSTSTLPPIHPNPNMDSQERTEAQEFSPIFADGRTMRTPPAGTIARGYLRDNTELYFGRTASGSYVSSPVKITRELLDRGQDRFNIYCAPCHGELGDGKGMVAQYAPFDALLPTYHQDRLRDVEDGYLFEVLSNGLNNMPSHKAQIPDVNDRWAIVAYIRVLQNTQAGN